MESPSYYDPNPYKLRKTNEDEESQKQEKEGSNKDDLDANKEEAIKSVFADIAEQQVPLPPNILNSEGPPRRPLPPTPAVFTSEEMNGPPRTPLPPIPDSLQQSNGPPEIPLPSIPKEIVEPKQSNAPPKAPLPPIPSEQSPVSSLQVPPNLMQSFENSSVSSRSIPRAYSRINTNTGEEYGEKIDDKIQSHMREVRYKASGYRDIEEEDIQVDGRNCSFKVPDIAFSQSNLISDINPDNKTHRSLAKINARFDGLCEIICNKILIDDLLGNTKKSEELEIALSFDNINQKKIVKSHIVDVMPVVYIIAAFVSKYYPDNIFTNKEQSNLIVKTQAPAGSRDKYTYKINPSILKKGLSKIEIGENLKLEIFKKKGIDFSGHALLIKKMDNDKYIFFDPEVGEFRNLSFEELNQKIDQEILVNDGTDVFFMKGSDYLKRLGIKNKKTL